LTGDLADPVNEEAAFDRADESPFASLTEEDRARAASILSGVGGGASDDDDTLELRPCPELNPPAQRFKHGRRAVGRVVLSRCDRLVAVRGRALRPPKRRWLTKT
jgi:hypothetical protein